MKCGEVLSWDVGSDTNACSLSLLILVIGRFSS